jgi:hypothetical protein
MTHAYKSAAECQKIYDAILAIDPETVYAQSDQRMWLTTLAKETRAFLKMLGISSRMISVTVPTYANASMVHVGVPEFDRYSEVGLDTYDYVAFGKLDEETKARVNALGEEMRGKRNDVQWHLLRILRRAFPQCDDRGDSMTDYYDDPFFIWA